MLLTATEIRKAFYIAYCLHPDRQTAKRIILSALCDWLPILHKEQQKQQRQREPLARLNRRKSLQPYKLSLPKEGLLQASVYGISEAWECDQEQQTSRIADNIYQPTPDDLLVRYVKFLVARTMNHRSVYTALGLGCQLYQYRPTQISCLAPDLFLEGNIRRIHSTLLGWISQRFPTLSIEQRPPYGEKKVRTRRPLAHERDLIRNALKAFAPWWTPCLQSSESLLALFSADGDNANDDVFLEGRRIHALVDPTCAGLECFIHAYNTERKGDAMSLDAPEDRLEIPAFPPEKPPASSGQERFNPSSLSGDAIFVIQQTFARQQERRSRYQPGLLRVWVDGVTRMQFDPRDSVCPLFPVPLSATYIEVYGQDQDGELLLAVFPLSALETGEGEPPRVLEVTHEGGQTVELTVTSDVTDTAEGMASWSAQVTYRGNALFPRSLRLWARWYGRWQRFEIWLRRLFERRGVPAYATGVLLLLLISNVWLSILYSHKVNQSIPDSPTWRGGEVRPVRILLQFQGDSTEQDIRALLQFIGARLVDGPSADGRYVVEVPLRAADPDALEKVFRILRVRSDVLQFFEQVKGRP